MMQFSAGDNVIVRGARYVVDAATAFDDCMLLSLSAANPGLGDRTCKLLLPFDRPVKPPSLPSVRVVTRRRWMRHLQMALSELRIFGELQGAARAAIDILPFQLEPALALISGCAARFLLADEVGLGKTIQAALMLVELQQRGWCDRALIVTPAGLRRQWAEELHRRFDLHSSVMDAATLAALASSLPRDVNPWSSEPVTITSIDFLKRPEVLKGLCAQVWDLVIVDEAHQASTASQRYGAVRVLAERSRYVVLLTATPHGGDDAAYRALCDLGRMDRSEPMLLFRRTRTQVGLARARRVQLLPVRLTPEAMKMHHLLADYARRLWRIAEAHGRHDLRLVAMVLSKRAFSSPGSLAASIERRLAAISGSLPTATQSGLPFEDDTEPADEAPCPDIPAFDSRDEEQIVLGRLLAAAKHAETGERKVHALKKLIRRTHEPILVFTEYRDTLATLETAVGDRRRTAVLHGGQTPEERRHAVGTFVSGAANLLLATDAGSEGLNLQSRCRLVVNLELPWNPTRLEQRIGRVDRIGQARTVHAINLFAEGTAESTVLRGLLRRLDRIHASEIEVAAAVISNAPLPVSAPAGVDGLTKTVDLKAAARTEATRLSEARSVPQALFVSTDAIIPVASSRPGAIRSRALRSLVLRSPDHKPGGSAIWLIRIRIVNSLGKLIEHRLTAIATHGRTHAAPDMVKLPDRRRELRAIAEQMIDAIGPVVLESASQLAAERARAIWRALKESSSQATLRESFLCRAAATDGAVLIQPGLFDKRALKDQQVAEQQRRATLAECAGRAASFEADAAGVLANKPEIALLLFIRC
jgi:superfamily II DNA or RNA helicase